ncbi:MAG TPA: helix-hairpin-helix domain-containing protein [Polyangiaceae bacterium]|nr:helix-hairpin-helix domain-containing protein [Polyangiaceae bacterium]
MTTHSSHDKDAVRGMRGILASLHTLRSSVWGKPIARALLLVAGLAVLALVGRAAGAKTNVPVDTSGATSTDAGAPLATPSPDAAIAPPPTPCSATPVPSSGRAAHEEATPEDPVILNTAGVDDLRRLPGVGIKRAEAILALRARLGHFRQLEDLLRVRGMGRATLRRLRPVVRLNPQPETANSPPP